MTGVAGVRNFKRFRQHRRNELEGVAPHIDIRDRLFNLWHVTRDAFATGTLGAVMRVSLDCRSVRAIRRGRTVATKAQLVRRFE